MPRAISEEEANKILARPESHFWDDKSAKSKGGTIQKIGCAFANADGGEFAVGIEDRKAKSGLDRWQGFASEEDGNFIHQSLVKDVDPGVPYAIDWLEIEGKAEQGIIALITIQKSASVHKTASDQAWIRRGAQNFQLDQQGMLDLALSKGTRSYEDQMLDKYSAEDLSAEQELRAFLDTYSPATEPPEFVHKQRLDDKEGRASVAGAVLYAEAPSVVVPKKCAIKIARYATKDKEPKRDHLDGTPITVEGPAYVQINETLRIVAEMIESVSIMDPDGSLVPARYPPEALKEVVVNAVIHRDYNISDDILVWVFDNRIEVRSPGVLPGHMTLENLLSERFARNPTIVRLLNKYPDPPNKDIGEGLNTVFAKMREAKLQDPEITTTGTAFVVTLGHTPLARPHELVMEYLQTHDEISNRIGRELSGITSENTMKDVFLKLAKNGQIERVPGKQGSKSAWRKPVDAQTSLDVPPPN
jgi:ATP-dependent DNA helicase RecG